ncbi:MAG: tetratricopeptide repeat protein [Deltaproteobacteria bacterium]|nr:tetratricopeptide repeat protein [Deltaproteobacteria bacterium]
MTVSIDKFWIEGVLTEAFPRFLEAGGADLDKNGKIEGREVFGDLDGDGTVGDPDDYKKYLAQNRAPLSTAVPFFKYGERLVVENRVHRALYLLSDIHSGTDMASAYTFIADLVEAVGKGIGEEKGSAIGEAHFYYTVMRRAGIVFMDQEDSSLVANIKERRLDCDTSSFVAMAIGDERGVELRGVRSLRHFFLRGRDEEGAAFNIDFGKLKTDTDYRVEPELVEKKIYLATLDDRQLETNFLTNRGAVLKKLGRDEEALAAYDKAIAIDPNYAYAHNNRGNVLEKLGRDQEALASFDKALAIDLNEAFAHYNRGVVLCKLGRYEEALASFDKVIAIDPNYADAHYNRGAVLKKLGRDEEALASYDRAIAIDPNHAFAHNNRVRVLFKLGRYKEALKAFARASQLKLGL